MAERRNLLLTRPQAQAQAFAAVLEARLPGRFRPVVAPLIAIAPVPSELDLGGLQGLIFTSANGVGQFAARSPERGLPAFCVGEMTAAAARAAGFAARSADGDVVALAALVAREAVPGAGGFLHLRGRHAAGDLVGRLAAAGLEARAAEIYDQTPCPLPEAARSLLAEGRAEVLAFFSPRTARLFAAEARQAGWNLEAATSVSLSLAADAALADLAIGERVVTRAPTREGMLDALGGLMPSRAT
jgi:uroporphyrinogen-III synthase